MILMIQPPKVLEISEDVMRMMELDLVGKAILMTNYFLRLLENLLTAFPVTHYHSSFYYNLQVLMFSLFWGGNPMK